MHVSATQPVTGSSKKTSIKHEIKSKPENLCEVAEYSNPVMTSSNRVPQEKVKHVHMQHLLVVCVALLVVAINSIKKAADNMCTLHSL